MTMNKLESFLASLVIVAVAVIAILWGTTSTRELEVKAKADKLGQICTFAKLTLQNDLRVVEGDPSALRATIIDRIYGTTAGDDATMIDACTSVPFNVAAWRACKYGADHPCLVRVLTETIGSIP